MTETRKLPTWDDIEEVVKLGGGRVVVNLRGGTTQEITTAELRQIVIDAGF